MDAHEFAETLAENSATAADRLHAHHATAVETSADRLKETLPREIAEAELRLEDMLFRIQAPYGSGGSGLW